MTAIQNKISGYPALLLKKMYFFFAGIKPQTFFLVSSFFFGMLLVFANAPFQEADGYFHFTRAYQCADKITCQHAANVPRVVNEMIAMNSDLPGNECNKQKVSDLKRFARTEADLSIREKAMLAPDALFPHLPQGAGVAIARSLHLPPLWWVYCARICNLLFWIAMMYAAIRLTPIFKWVFVLISLMPMTIYLGSSLSYDAMRFGSSFLMIALILRLAYMPDVRLSFKYLGAIGMLLAVIALSKPAYVPLVFLALIIPFGKISQNKHVIRGMGFAFLFIVVIASFYVLHHYVLPIMGSDMTAAAQSGSVVHQQMLFMLSHPLEFFWIIIKTVFYYESRFYVRSFVGNLGWLDISLSPVFVVLYCIILVAAALTDSATAVTVSRKDKIIAASVSVFILLFIETMYYVLWTANPQYGGIGYKSVTGPQGRFFIPIAPLLLLILYNRKCAKADVVKKYAVPAMAVFVFVSLVYTVWAVFSRYYIPC